MQSQLPLPTPTNNLPFSELKGPKPSLHTVTFRRIPSKTAKALLRGVPRILALGCLGEVPFSLTAHQSLRAGVDAQYLNLQPAGLRAIPWHTLRRLFCLSLDLLQPRVWNRGLQRPLLLRKKNLQDSNTGAEWKIHLRSRKMIVSLSLSLSLKEKENKAPPALTCSCSKSASLA